MSIKLDLKIFLFIILFWLTSQIEIYAIIMIFAFIHEIGHLVCGLILGFKPNSIKVNPFGFQIHFKTDAKDYNQKRKNGNKLCFKKMLIALAGPFINLLIAFICLWIPQQLFSNIDIIIYANLLLAIFNLLPVYPLDGGRFLQELLHIYKGREKSYEITNTISKIMIILLTILTSIVILYIHNIAFIVILAYLWCLVIKNEKEYNTKKKVYEQVKKARKPQEKNIEKEFVKSNY